MLGISGAVSPVEFELFDIFPDAIRSNTIEGCDELRLRHTPGGTTESGQASHEQWNVSPAPAGRSTNPCHRFLLELCN
jgi:hypothetical protein